MNNRQFLAYFMGYHSPFRRCKYYTHPEEVEYFLRGFDDRRDGYKFGKFDYRGDI